MSQRLVRRPLLRLHQLISLCQWNLLLQHLPKNLPATLRLGDLVSVRPLCLPCLQHQRRWSIFVQVGISLALDAAGRRIAVGATRGGVGTGRVWVYDYIWSNWNVVGQEMDGLTAVSLSRDGQVLATAADGTDTNGSDSGTI